MNLLDFAIFKILLIMRFCYTAENDPPGSQGMIHAELGPVKPKSKVTAKLAYSISPTSSAQPALPGFSGRAGWAELVGEIELANLAANFKLLICMV